MKINCLKLRYTVLLSLLNPIARKEEKRKP